MTFKRILFAGITIYLLSGQVVVAQAADQSMNSLVGNVGIAAITNEVLDKEKYIEYVDNAIGASWGYDELGIAVVEEGNLNVREEASTSSKIVGKMYNNAACEILGETDGWYHITSGEVEGYVSSEFIVTGIQAKMLGLELAYERAVVQEDGVNVRTAPSQSSKVLTKVAAGEELEVIEEIDGWVKCRLNTDEVYVSADYVEIVDGLNTAITITQFKYGMDVSDVRVDLCEYALEFVGNPYVWGGTSPSGFDCSGFVKYVFANFGVNLPRTSYSQMNVGTPVTRDELVPGDLGVFRGGGHVGIYVGNNQYIHAPQTGRNVSVEAMNRELYCARRLVY